MERDNRGRYKRNDDEEEGFLNRRPNNKTLLVLLFLIWFVFGYVPVNAPAAKRGLCDSYCPCPEFRNSGNSSQVNSTYSVIEKKGYGWGS